MTNPEDTDPEPTPWRQLILPLVVCVLGLFVGLLLKGAGNTSILGSVTQLLAYVAFIAVLALVIGGIGRMR